MDVSDTFKNLTEHVFEAGGFKCSHPELDAESSEYQEDLGLPDLLGAFQVLV
jgi:hypothetical protein